jgi:isopentenyl diphosphate isomerase/L-lactate dehydrogenase-like FMN-dependent dehydrogenase
MHPLNAHEYESAARKLLPAPVYAYYSGGACDEHTLADNPAAFRAALFRPRVLVPVPRASCTRSDLSALLGARAAHASMPLLVAPMAMQRMAHPDGELATARAAARARVPLCVSTLATASVEDIAEAADAAGGACLLFQLYVYKDRRETVSLVQRAKAVGYTAVVLTVDTPRLGRRERDLREGFTLPDGITLGNFPPDDDRAALGQGRVGESALAYYGGELLDAGLTFEDITWLVREAAPLPVWVKGIVRGDDAILAVDAGAKCIVVSNHGARQLDGVVPTMDALPEVVAAVGARVPVIVDSGVRRGADICRALAMGATAVMLGRPVLWALAVDGQAGVERLLGLIREEMALCMSLLGARDLSELTADKIVMSRRRAGKL